MSIDLQEYFISKLCSRQKELKKRNSDENSKNRDKMGKIRKKRVKFEWFPVNFHKNVDNRWIYRNESGIYGKTRLTYCYTKNINFYSRITVKISKNLLKNKFLYKKSIENEKTREKTLQYLQHRSSGISRLKLSIFELKKTFKNLEKLVQAQCSMEKSV